MLGLIATSSEASVAPVGSLITSGAKYVVTPAVPPPLDYVRIDAFTPQGSLIRTISRIPPSGDLVAAIASDLANNLLGVEGTLVTINDDGSQSRVSVVLPEDQGSLSPDSRGNVYIGQLRITRVSGGQIAASYNPSLVDGSIQKVAQFIDLGPDQCTLYFTDGIHPVIYRFDICQGIPLAQLTVNLPNGVPGDLRVLPNGQILIAVGSAGVVLADIVSGVILRTYATPAKLLALAPDRTSFWIGSGSVAKRVDFQTAAVLATVDTGLDQLNGLTVVGEPRAAFAAALVPTLSNLVLIVLILAIAGIGFWRLR